MNSPIQTYFNQFTKDELSVILNYFEHPAKKSTKKAELVDMVSDLIVHPREWLYRLMERDLRLLRDLVAAGPEQWVKVEMPEYPSMLDLLHLVYIDDYSSEDVYACLDRALYFAVGGIIDEVIKEKEEDGSFKRERIVLGFLNIYGAIPVGDFVEAVFDAFDGDEEANTDIVMGLADCQLVALQKAFYKDDVHMVSPFTFDHQQIIDSRDNFPDVKDFARYPLEIVEQTGTGVPYCAFGRGSDEYNAVMDSLSGIGYTDRECEEIISEIWQNSQYTMEDSFAEAMFDSVNSKMDDIDSFDDYRKAIDAIAAYANSVPKWLLKGHTSNELNMLKLSIRIDEHYIDEGTDPFELELPEEKLDDVPGPLKEFYKYGIGVRHVRPDDPCPCGSGLSYCRCHGKNLN